MKIDSKIFDFIFEMAFRDATMRNAFPNPYKQKKVEATEEEKKLFKDLKDAIRDAIKKPVKNYLDNVISGEMKKNDDAVYECIKTVLENADGVCKEKQGEARQPFSFTFGHAQKVVNMAAKYLYIACYAKPDLREFFACCHCPMDEYMIKGVIDASAEYKDEIKESKLRKDRRWSRLLLEDVSGDGEEDFKAYAPAEYKMFQELVHRLKKEGTSPLEYDFENWPKFAVEYGE